MSHLMAEHRGVPLIPGVDRIYLPSEMEYLKRSERLKSCIPLETYVMTALA